MYIAGWPLVFSTASLPNSCALESNYFPICSIYSAIINCMKSLMALLFFFRNGIPPDSCCTDDLDPYKIQCAPKQKTTKMKRPSILRATLNVFWKNYLLAALLKVALVHSPVCATTNTGLRNAGVLITTAMHDMIGK